MSTVQILECDTELFFHLQQQQMIELIRDGRIVDALLFAQEYLAYKGEENPGMLDELGTCLPIPLIRPEHYTSVYGDISRAGMQRIPLR